jgi:hypothetical protein
VSGIHRYVIDAAEGRSVLFASPLCACHQVPDSTESCVL